MRWHHRAMVLKVAASEMDGKCQRKQAVAAKIGGLAEWKTGTVRDRRRSLGSQSPDTRA
jgi:hypothetical protein